MQALPKTFPCGQLHMPLSWLQRVYVRFGVLLTAFMYGFMHLFGRSWTVDSRGKMPFAR